MGVSSISSEGFVYLHMNLHRSCIRSMQGSASVRQPYFRVLGIVSESQGASRSLGFVESTSCLSSCLFCIR